MCCSRCPCSVHLHCVGLRDAKHFLACTHHHCSVCFKNRASAGGLLFPCESCPSSFCEDCLPSKGVTFLDRVERFDKLGFDSTTRVVYIHCSPICENYAKQEYGYVPRHETKLKCPDAMDLSDCFGASYDLDAAQAALKAEKDKVLDSGGVSTRRGKTVQRYFKPKPRSPGTGRRKKREKLCAQTSKVVGQYDTRSEAARSVGTYGARLTPPIRSVNNAPMRGC